MAVVQAAEMAGRVGQTHVPLPKRFENIKKLKSTKEFDVLVIGGGATGSGVALDAVTRGLTTVIVERDDFSAGTSSRSTKLIHGGVRYLQKAITGLDREQYKLVKEALHERANLLAIAPHLSSPLPIMLPVYKWWQLPYFWAGIKMYDLVSGRQVVKSSYLVGKEKALELFPMLKKDKLCGAIIYYDGQHNDARMNLEIALTAVRHGATAVNHTEVLSLLKKSIVTDAHGAKEVVCGVHVRDTLSNEEYDIHAKCVVNATGPFTDSVRTMDKPDIPKISQASSGIHLVLPSYYSPKNMGLLDPATSDGRVIFFLPWEGRTIAGTTDTPSNVSFEPEAQEVEIQFVLSEIKHYLGDEVNVRRGDVLAAWSGIRPLVRDPKSKSTASIARNHVIDISESNLVTIAGGKWTTYRSMAQDTVDACIKTCKLEPVRDCQTDGLLLEGGQGFTPNFHIRLIQDFGLEEEVAINLAHNYGNKAPQVALLASLTGKRWPVVGQRLIPEFPYIEAEVRYAVREYACTAIDVLARRIRIAFLDVRAAKDAATRIVEIMAEELNWDKERQQKELHETYRFLGHMGLTVHNKVGKQDVNVTDKETDQYKEIFKHFDIDNSGSISFSNLRKILHDTGEAISDDQLRELIHEVSTKTQNSIELDEFLQVMTAHRKGIITHNRFAAIIDRHFEHLRQKGSVVDGKGV
ncbi:glycerol-3-phosphate dehydrogenase, mitochondrial isoform X2 [Exaiptasia diaphana]|nr:glycerol-3-phosphate dehydrogenase, mitochondrial isoform X2 [Exaiptasia diaphana]